MERILIIEDDMSIAEVEKGYLELSGFGVDIEPDGQEGLKKALTGQYQLILLDLVLPGLDGFEICRKFREKYLTPVVIVSAKKEEFDKIRGLGLGADDYVTKPFSAPELVARVKAHLQRYQILTGQIMKKEEAKDILTVRELKMDRAARRVFIRGEEKKLTPKEFDLLYFFASNPNCVFKSEELLQKVWGSDLANKATLTVHIKKIREKIERDTKNPEYIETSWGEGYILKKEE